MALTIGLSVGAPLIGGLIGNIAGSSDRRRAQEAIAEAYKILEGVGMPPDLSKAIIYKQFQSAGSLSPTIEADIDEVHSSLAGYKASQELTKDQQDALKMLQQKVRSGLGPEDRLAMMQLQNQAQQAAQAKSQQITQEMQARNQWGGGAELAAQLAAGQGSANQQAMGALQVAADNERARMQALTSYAGLAGQMRNQDLAEAQTTKGAADEIAKFNQMNSIGRNQRVAANIQDVNRYNLDTKQGLLNRNTDMYNQEQLRQVNEQGRLYDRQMTRAQGLANAKLGQAGNYQQQAGATQQMWTGLGSAMGSAAQAYGNYQQQNAMQDRQDKRMADYNKAQDARVNRYLSAMNKPVGADAELTNMNLNSFAPKYQEDEPVQSTGSNWRTRNYMTSGW